MNNDEAKPVSAGYDFGDDWLEELEEALDFDMPQCDGSEGEQDTLQNIHESDKANNSSDHDESEASRADVQSGDDACEKGIASDDMGADDGMAALDVAVEENEPLVNAELADEIVISDEAAETAQIDEAPSAKEVPASESPEDMAQKSKEDKPSGHAIVAKMLDIAALQKSITKAGQAPVLAEENKAKKDDEQIWQFVSLIVMRLFDDLELLIVQKHCEESCDVMKQLNRLANILSFAGMEEQLPLLAYIGNLLPISFTDAEIGEPTERRFDVGKMRRFIEKSNEILNCLVYLITYFKQHAPSFDANRFSDILEQLYVALDAAPGQPSPDAPLPGGDGINPQELTTRTLIKLARTLEALVSESMHYLESAVFYGYSKGFEDAAKSLDNAAQIVKEYKLTDFEGSLKIIYNNIRHLRTPNTPSREVYAEYYKIIDLLQKHFCKQINEKKIRHLQALISKFESSDKKDADIPFCNRWQTFIKAALPNLEFEYCAIDDLHERVRTLKTLADGSNIRWLSETFSHLDNLWEAYGGSCAEVFISLAEELRAFPTEDIEEKDIEQLNHPRIETLFARKPDDREPSAFTVVDDAQQLADTLLQQLEEPTSISAAHIYDLLINARRIHCHAIERACEILTSLLGRIPAKEGNTPVVVSESVVDALYFTAGFLQTICDRLRRYLNHDAETCMVKSHQLFYTALMSLYQTPGQPRDGITSFVVKQVNYILNELQLVWVNTSTATSTEYYCSLIRKLLHLSTICELGDLRKQLIAHLDDIPPQDFINTENRMMQRQCARIIRIVEDSCPRINVMPSSQQVVLFFCKTIAAFNQLLSSRDANEPRALIAEISRIEMRMSILGMTTDFPPVIAFIFELHHMAFAQNITRTDVEDLLYQLINVANNVCPEWIQPKDAELEFVRTAMPIPMQLFQEMLDAATVVHDSLKTRTSEDPVAWENISSLYNSFHNLIGYLPYTLQVIQLNAQNRSRYLKKNIFIDLDTSGYPKASEINADTVPPVIAAAFGTIVEKLLEIIIDCAFLSTDNNSRINVVLQPFANEVSASIFHNGKLFTTAELNDRLAKVNIIPAQDDNLLDLLVSSRRLVVSYPPVNSIAYILPILRQFNGTLELSDDKNGNTRLYLRFKL